MSAFADYACRKTGQYLRGSEISQIIVGKITVAKVPVLEQSNDGGVGSFQKSCSIILGVDEPERMLVPIETL